MKLILIIIVFVGGLSFSAWKTVSYFNEQKQVGLEAQRREKSKLESDKAVAKALEEERAKVAAQAAHAPPAMVPVDRPVVGEAPPVQMVVGSYRFVHRLVPDAPQFLKDDSQGMIVQSEQASNSWVWMGSPLLASQILDLAKAYDVRQQEMDLDFVLVLVNTERLQARGLSLFYDQRANWLEALSLSADSGSLRITAGGLAVDVALSDSTTGLSLLSQPVIRCVDGQPWKFSTDSEVPVPKSEIVEGTVRNSIEFKSVGFGLEGTVRIVGQTILLKVDQRNGSIAPAASPDAEVPIFNNQSLQTTCELGFGEWTVLGGLQVDKEELRKGFFRNSLKASTDYLVIFVRPRLALEAPPAAVPVTSATSRGNPLLESGLLPPPRWLDDEIDFVEKRIEKLKRSAK